ncbi:MAG: hypothetical protein KJ645_13680, partial [Planctomycetes bacterium]|nr:hypothetical protein [Planctomycetota bacterium]
MTYPPIAILTVLIALCPSAFSQDTGPAPPTPFDRVVELVLDESDPPLEGHGPAEWVEFDVEFSGGLHVWTSSELDLFLRVEDPDGNLISEDEDSGGGKTPYLWCGVEPGSVLRIAVACSGETTAGAVSLHLAAGIETDSTHETAELGTKALAEAQRKLDAGEFEEARALLASTLEKLQKADGSLWSDKIAKLSWDLGHAAWRAGNIPSTRGAWSISREHYERTFPESHRNLLLARQNLAVTMKRMGDLSGA